ncbi:MAG TPA: phosphotransferase [Acidimicrobiales bacterium]
MTGANAGPADAAGNGAEAAAAALRTAARTMLGRDVELAGPPQVSVRDGWGAFRCALAPTDAAAARPPWDGPLIVRLAPPPATGTGGAGPTGVGPTAAGQAGSTEVAGPVGPVTPPAGSAGPLANPTPPTAPTPAAALAHEAAWHALGAAHGLEVPTVVAEVPGDAGPSALVLATGHERSLLECVNESRPSVPRVAALMGDLHARLHALPVDGAPPVAQPRPLDALDDLLVASGIAGGHFSAELDNLRRRQPPPAPPVVCHRRFELTSVRLDPTDPGRTATVVDWSAAGLGEREYDVAHTLMAFWSLPYLAAGRARRRALRTVRDALIDGYRSAYEHRAPLDESRLRFWEAFHALSWSARMAAGDGTSTTDPWDPIGAVTFRDSYRKDLTRRFVGLTRGQ